MKHFVSIDDVEDPKSLVERVAALKKNPLRDTDLGRNKVLGLMFFNSSLRTRMSTTRAAYNLGMDVMVLNVSADSWQLETQDGVTMDKGNAEHIKEAIPVMSAYCDFLGVRAFPSLQNSELDYNEVLIRSFVAHSSCPIINLESATLHPLQSLADMVTIEEYKTVQKPKVVLTWAPHVKPIPQSVANSFSQWVSKMDYDFTITNPPGFDLAPTFQYGAKTEHDQELALKDADFVYVKNWSSYTDYGKVGNDASWMITAEKMEATNNGKLMHCLPVRRNVVIAEDAIESSSSIIQPQAENRLYATQTVLKELLLNHSKWKK